jgi:uncharacterized protein
MPDQPVAPAVDAAVRPYLDALGVPGIVDVHVHFMPDAVERAVWDFFDRADVEYGTAWPISYRHDDAARLRILRDLGVLAFPSLVYAHKPAMATWLNDWALDFAARTPGCLPTMTFYPEPGVADYVRAALDRGARIAKVHLQVGAFDPRDHVLDDVWGQLVDAGLPVVIHCGSGPVPGPFTGPGPVTDLLARHPDLRLVIAHLGAPEYADFFDLVERNDGLSLDVTMACTDFMGRFMPLPDGEVPRLRDLARDGRVLFGSDYPNIPYPYAHQIEALARLDLGDAAMREILWGAGARMFGITGSA